MIIQSVSSGRLDDSSDTGAACPDTVTHIGGGKRKSLTKQQATTPDYHQQRYQNQINTTGKALAGYLATEPAI